MRGIDAGIEHCDNRSLTVIAAGPRLIRLDKRDTAREHGLRDCVFHYAKDVPARAFECSKPRGVQLQSDVRDGHVLVNDALATLRQPGKCSRLHCRDGVALPQHRGAIGEASFGNNGNVGAKLHEHAHVSVACCEIPQSLLNLRRGFS